ncbi:MAG: class I SAM-dependent methyltransferase [Chloroflexi bacterium]|nr:class I SAM-dependent methyltransferase [Chloroflexota bacterium]
MLSELFKRNRRLLNESIQDPRRRTYISPAVYATDRALLPALAEHARGVLLDVGAGDVPYRSLLAGQVDRHDTFDVEHRTDALTYVGDIHDMHMVADNAYDTVLCLSVLEHVREPFRAIGELARILRPGGRLILTVPHLSRLHEEPHDYFRYTQYGLRSLLESAGLEEISIGAAGGLFAFLGHQVSTVLLCSVWHVPLLRGLAYWLNKWLVVRPIHWLDARLDRRRIFALGYVCVAAKPAVGPEE